MASGNGRLYRVVRSAEPLPTTGCHLVEVVIADGALGEAAPAHTLDAETIGLQMAGISTDATDAA